MRRAAARRLCSPENPLASTPAPRAQRAPRRVHAGGRVSRAVVRLRRVWRRSAYAVSRVVARALARRGGFAMGLAAGIAREGMYWLRPDLTRRDLANLALALPDLPAGERRRVLRASLARSARASLEFLQLIDASLDVPTLCAGVRAQGLEHLDQALANGRGAVAVSTHLGHFAIAPLWLAARGYPVSVVLREAKHVPPGLYANAMEHLGLAGIVADDTRGVAREVLRALRAGRIVFLYLDQGVKRSGAVVQFLGKPVAMPEGPVVFARRAGAPVVPVLLDPETRTVRVEEPFDFAARARQGETATAQVRLLADLAAREIRAHPRHWQWRHRRWARDGASRG